MRGVIGEDVAGLAVEHLADGFKRGEADGFGLAGFKDGEVGQGDVDLLRELSERHGAAVEDFVEGDGDGHSYTVPSRSSRIAAPAAKTRLSTKTIRMAIQPPMERSKPGAAWPIAG